MSSNTENVAEVSSLGTDANQLTNIIQEQAERIKLLETESEQRQHDLKDAILECAREEVIRAIRDIPCLGSSNPNDNLRKKSRRGQVNQCHRAKKTKSYHSILSEARSDQDDSSSIPRLQSWPKCESRCGTASSSKGIGSIASQRPKTAVNRKNKARPKTSWNQHRRTGDEQPKNSILTGAKRAYAEHRPKTVGSVCAGRTNHRFIPGDTTELERLEEDNILETENNGSIALSSLNWLKKSAKIVKDNTGRQSLPIFSNQSEEQLNDSSDFSQTTEFHESEEHTGNHPSFHCSDTFYGERLTRPQSWPMPRRSISSSHSSTRPRPRPTTALERRKPRPRTSAVYRNKAEQFGRNLLGPINFDAEQRKDPVPHTLKGNEWENEIARNILSLYSNKVKSEMKQAEDVEVSPIEQEVANESFAEIFTERVPGEEARAHSSGSGNSFGPPMTEQSASNRPSSNFSTDRKHVGYSMESEEKYSNQITGTKTKLPEIVKSKKAKTARNLTNLRMIWLEGTGMVQTRWNPLERYGTGNVTIWSELATLEERGRYLQYVKTLESFLCSGKNTIHGERNTTEGYQLWRQLILTCNGFGSKLINQQKYPKALELLEKAQSLISYDRMIDPGTANELTAFIKDTYGQYYAKRNKPNAALQYITSAMNIHRRRNDVLNASKCRLHTAYILFQLGRYDESGKTMNEIIDLVDSGTLHARGDSDNYQLVLLVAVTYHNIAVQQLTVGRIGDACISSQNARRLARLCLSVSSRYIPNFEATHKKALSELTSLLEKEQNTDQALVFKKLINDLFQ